MDKLQKHVLAAYYNDARLNILNCLNDVRSKVFPQSKPFENDNQIVELMRTLDLANRTPEIQDKMMEQLRNRFRFLDVLLDVELRKGMGKTRKESLFYPSPENYTATLLFLFELINNLRNSMAHPEDDEFVLDFSDQKRVFFDLNDIYNSSRRIIKQRFNHIAATLTPILLHNPKGHIKPAGNFSFALSADPKKNKQQSAKKQSQVIHDFGHVLLCSLFLDKSQSADLISRFWQSGHNKFWNTDQQSMMKELISVYRVWLPIQRLQASDTPTAVTIDALSQLSRCPRRLLEMLSAEDKERFRTGDPETDDSDNENESSFLMLRGHQNKFVPLMMRFLDMDNSNKLRFAVDLGQYYFNVRLKGGKHFTDNEPRIRRLGSKMVAYGRLSDFEGEGKKPESWKQLEANFAEIPDEDNLPHIDDIEQLTPYIVQTFPHYHHFDDKIGFKLTRRYEDVTNYPDLPTINTNNKKPERAMGKSMLPDFWMSPVQFLHLSFYCYLQKQADKKSSSSYPDIDNLLNQYRAGMKKVLTQVNSELPCFQSEPDSSQRREEVQNWVSEQFSKQVGKLVSLSDLPKVLVHHLVRNDNRQLAKEEVIKRAESMIESTTNRLEHTERRLKSHKMRGQQGFKPIKCGYMGDFLSEDLLRFQPIDESKRDTDGGKINSQQYQILQKTLAYYSMHIEKPPQIVELLKDCGLLKGEFKHPFLEKLDLQHRPDKYSGLLSFYDAYLTARKNHLKGFINDLSKQPSLTNIPKWLRLRMPSTLENWLADYKDDQGEMTVEALPLPKHFFYQPILNMAASEIGISSEALEDHGMQCFTRNNEIVEIRPAISWLIKRYMAAQNDESQAMYRDYKRSHNLFDTHLDKRKGGGMYEEKTTHHMSEQQRKSHLVTIQKKVRTFTDSEKDSKKKDQYKGMLKSYKRTEREIRHASIQDMVLFLYAKQNLDKQVLPIPADKLKLKSLQKTLLNTSIKIDLIEPQTKRVLRKEACKIRNLGEFQLQIRDRRLPSLLKYYPDNNEPINAYEVRDELASYRRVRVKVMELVHSLEKSIVQCCGAVREGQIPDELKSDFGGRHGDYLYALYALHRHSGTSNRGFDKQSFINVRLIRNALSHNQYPDTEDFSNIQEAVRAEPVPENPTLHRKVAEQFFDEMERIYTPWLNDLKQRRLAEA